MNASNRNEAVAVILAGLMFMAAAQAAAPQHLSVRIGGLDAQGQFENQAAFCSPAASRAKNVSPSVTWSPQGIDSDRVVPHGKPIGETAHGRRGVNIFTNFLAANAEMAATHGGHDGPCPPVNDAQIHRHVIRIFALDAPLLGLSGAFDGPAVEKAMLGHILATGQASGTYTLNSHLPTKAGQ